MNIIQKGRDIDIHTYNENIPGFIEWTALEKKKDEQLMKGGGSK